MNHRNFRGRKGLSQTSEFNTLGLSGDDKRPNPHGDVAGGAEWDGSVKAGREGEKARSQRSSRQESRDPLRLQGLSHGDRARLDLLKMVQ